MRWTMKTKVSDRYKVSNTGLAKTRSSVMQTDDANQVSPNPYETKTSNL